MCFNVHLLVKPAEPLNHGLTLVQDIEGSTSVSKHVEVSFLQRFTGKISARVCSLLFAFGFYCHPSPVLKMAGE